VNMIIYTLLAQECCQVQQALDAIGHTLAVMLRQTSSGETNDSLRSSLQSLVAGNTAALSGEDRTAQELALPVEQLEVGGLFFW
jgi:hypothetical protein